MVTELDSDHNKSKNRAEMVLFFIQVKLSPYSFAMVR